MLDRINPKKLQINHEQQSHWQNRIVNVFERLLVDWCIFQSLLEITEIPESLLGKVLFIYFMFHSCHTRELHMSKIQDGDEPNSVCTHVRYSYFHNDYFWALITLSSCTNFEGQFKFYRTVTGLLIVIT